MQCAAPKWVVPATCNAVSQYAAILSSNVAIPAAEIMEFCFKPFLSDLEEEGCVFRVYAVVCMRFIRWILTREVSFESFYSGGIRFPDYVPTSIRSNKSQ